VPQSLIQSAGAVLVLLIGLNICHAADQLDAPDPGTFSFVIIPDTQAYFGAGTKGHPENMDPVTNPIFQRHVDWIVRNLDRQKIVFVSHVGDIVDINEPRQWKVAQHCMDGLHGKVPYGISVGNHDMKTAGDSSLFQQSFPAERFQQFPWYGGTFAGDPQRPHMSDNNANSFQLFSVNGKEFLFLHLECNAPDNVVNWANALLTQHADRVAFITSHMGWGPEQKPKTNDDFISAPKGRMQWSKMHGKRGNTPQQLWEKCYSLHPNLFAVFSGDQSRTQAWHAITPGQNGNPVHEILQDYGTGWLRLVRFSPAQNQVQVITFDPRTEELCTGTKLVPRREDHQYQFAGPWGKPEIPTATPEK